MLGIKGDIKKFAKPQGAGKGQKRNNIIFRMARLSGLSTFSAEAVKEKETQDFWRNRGDEFEATISEDSEVTGKELVNLLFSGKYDLTGCLGLMFKKSEDVEDIKFQSAENLFFGLRVAELTLEEYLLNALGLRDWTVSIDIGRLADEYAEQWETKTFSEGEDLGEHVEKEVLDKELSVIKKNRSLKTIRILLEGIAQCNYSESKTAVGVGGSQLWKNKGEEALNRFVKNVITNSEFSGYWVEDIKGIEAVPFLKEKGLMKVIKAGKNDKKYRFSILEMLGAMEVLVKKADNYAELMVDKTWANLLRLYLLTRLVQVSMEIFFTVGKGENAKGHRFTTWRFSKEYLNFLDPEEYIDRLKKPKAKEYVKEVSDGDIKPPNLAAA